MSNHRDPQRTSSLQELGNREDTPQGDSTAAQGLAEQWIEGDGQDKPNSGIHTWFLVNKGGWGPTMKKLTSPFPRLGRVDVNGSENVGAKRRQQKGHPDRHFPRCCLPASVALRHAKPGSEDCVWRS